MQGALAVREAVPEALLVFVQAPSREEQRRRLEARGSETPESLARRLGQAEAEEELARTAFDAIVVNHEVDQAVDERRCYPGHPPSSAFLSAAGPSRRGPEPCCSRRPSRARRTYGRSPRVADRTPHRGS